MDVKSKKQLQSILIKKLCFIIIMFFISMDIFTISSFASSSKWIYTSKMSVHITNKKAKFKVGDTYIFKADKSGVKEPLKWSVSNKKIAVINVETGKLITKAEGSVTVKVTADTFSDSYTFDVAGIIDKKGAADRSNVNKFLSDLYLFKLRNYDVNHFKSETLLRFALCNTAVMRNNNNNNHRDIYVNEKIEHIVDEKAANQILYKYFDKTLPKKDIGAVKYKNGNYHYPETWNCYSEEPTLPGEVVIANSIEKSKSTIKVNFDIMYVWPDNYITGESNKKSDNLYYAYDLGKAEKDQFCEIIGRGNAVLQLKNNKLIIKQFHVINWNYAEESNYNQNLTKGDAYQLLVKHWEYYNGNKNLPPIIECEFKDDWYLFWGYSTTLNHANTMLRIKINKKNGLLIDEIRQGIYSDLWKNAGIS